MLVLYLYTQQVNKLFIQLNNQKIFESQIHEVFFDYYFEGEGAWVTGRALSLKEQCHISRIFFFPFFLPFYKLLMDSVELKHINCITFTLFYIQRQQITAKSLSLQRLHPASIFAFSRASNILFTK